MMKSRSALVLLGCLPAALAASGSSQAEITERVKGAQKVVVATATDVRPQWRENAHGDRLIVSQVRLRVEETIKGKPGATALIEVEGGTLDGVTLRVSDVPEVKAGDRAVFLLDPGDAAAELPHRRGGGILKLDNQNRVVATDLRLEDIRRAAR